MKKIYFAFLVFMATTTFGQNSLYVNFEPKQDMFTADFHIYKNDSIIYKNCNLENFETLYNLEKGKYWIKYNTIFGADSVTIEFETNDEWKEVTLKTEHIDELKISNTKSIIESLTDTEEITLKYYSGACFDSDSAEITIKKVKNEYYKLKNGRKQRLSKNKIIKIIRYEKILQNLDFQSIDNITIVSTCGESFSIEKNGKQIFDKHINCNDWKGFSDIKKWIK